MSFKWGRTLVAMALAAACSATQAAGYPSDAPVKLVVGFTPGSTIDTTGRIIGEALSRRLKQAFVVENKTGANGLIAVRTVTQAKPDGYTLLVSNSSSITVNPLLFKDAKMDPLKDLAPVTPVISVPFVLLVNPENPRMRNIGDLKSLVDYARQNPDALTYGSAGNGNLMHLAAAQLATMSDVKMTHVPYRGAAPMEAALMSKEIDFGFDTLSGLPLVKSGKLKALAVSTAQRWQDIPEVPSVAELGYPGFDVGFWVGIFAPGGTPPEVVALLNKEINAVIKDPEVQKRLWAQGRPDPMSVDAFKKRISTELEQNADLITRAAIKAE